jgi:high-affinity Fe2+/Pb2+ permease
MTGLEQAAPAIAMVAAFVLVWFGVRLAMRPDTRTKGVLMVVMAAVLVGNVLVWTL